MTERNVLTDLIRRGRRRQLRNLFIREASFSAALALGGAILLLLVGTEFLNWYWLVILFAGSLAVGAYRARPQILSQYRVAQSIDRQLGFHDAISTAFYFDQHAGQRVAAADFIERQRQAADELARSADVRRGLPFFTPRTFYVNAALAVLVCGMFGLRYGINRSLDLRASLIPIGFDGFLGSSREVAAVKKIHGDRPFDSDGHRDKGAAVDPWESKAADLDPASDAALMTTDTPEVNNPDGGADPAGKAKGTGIDQQSPGDDPLESGEKGESSQPGSNSAGDQNSSPDGASQSGKQQSAPKNSNQQGNSGDSSLTDKVRDAFANLLAKMKMQPKSSDGKQGGSQSNSQQKQGQSSDPNASASQSQQQSDASPSAQAQGQQAQNGSQQAAQGKSDSHSSDRSNSPDGKSGIGKQDGDKSAHEAEQLAAMGKITEIIGKRAANVSGEVMVEVASGKQQLKTQYSQRKASHGEAGGEINRDEVPLAYQQYVQQYFEEVRKLPAGSKSKADSKIKTSGN
ncbi:MAG TPA: hypothetical protein VIX89_05470 [Bryobacteraceae bacterium]